MKKLLCLLFLPVFAWANNDSVVKAVVQSVQGSQITRIALRTIPHSSSLQMTIFTNNGERSLILSQRHIKTAVKTLTNSHLVGMNNVLVSRSFLQTSSFQKYTGTSISGLDPTHSRGTATSKKMVNHRIAMVNSTITAANQQASR